MILVAGSAKGFALVSPAEYAGSHGALRIAVTNAASEINVTTESHRRGYFPRKRIGEISILPRYQWYDSKVVMPGAAQISDGLSRTYDFGQYPAFLYGGIRAASIDQSVKNFLRPILFDYGSIAHNYAWSVSGKELQSTNLFLFFLNVRLHPLDSNLFTGNIGSFFQLLFSELKFFSREPNGLPCDTPQGASKNSHNNSSQSGNRSVVGFQKFSNAEEHYLEVGSTFVRGLVSIAIFGIAYAILKALGCGNDPPKQSSKEDD